MYSTFLINTCILKFSKRTPYQKLFKQKPNVTDLRVLGPSAHIFIPKAERNKLASTSKMDTIMVGCDSESKGYRCYCPTDRKIYVSRNVEFNENIGPEFAIPHDTQLLDTTFFNAIPTGDDSPATPTMTDSGQSTPIVASEQLPDQPEAPLSPPLSSVAAGPESPEPVSRPVSPTIRPDGPVPRRSSWL
jgi:hypothetical protein